MVVRHDKTRAAGAFVVAVAMHAAIVVGAFMLTSVPAVPPDEYPFEIVELEEEILLTPPVEPPKVEAPPLVELQPPEPVPVVPPVLTSEAPSEVPATFDVAPAVEEPPPAPPPPPVVVDAPPEVVVDDYVPPDVSAAYRNNPLPPYPLVAKRRGLEGVVVLAVSLNANGRPVKVEVKRSSGHGSLDETAMRSVRGWQFEPARRAGHPVAADVEVPLRFALK